MIRFKPFEHHIANRKNSGRLGVREKEPFLKVEDSARNDYEKGMPAAHTLFKVKSLALIANARKVYVSLRFLSECNWCELTSADCLEKVEPDADSDAA